MAAKFFNRNALIVAAIATLGSCATGAGALFSAEGAMEQALGEMCAPVVMEGASMDAITAERRIAEVDPTSDATGQSNRRWLLPAVSQTDVTLWEDGSCMVGVRRGSPEALRAVALNLLAERGVELSEGATRPAPSNGVRTAYCASGARPYFLVITTPGEDNDRPAIVATLNKAQGDRPDFCAAG